MSGHRGLPRSRNHHRPFPSEPGFCYADSASQRVLGNSVRSVLLIFCCALALPAVAQSFDDSDLLTAEQRDARLREQQELEAREQDLLQQKETTQELLEQQDAYLEALKAQIDAMKQPSQESQQHGTPR